MRDERQNRKVVQNCPQHFGYVGGIVIAAVLPRRGMMEKPKATARLKAPVSDFSPTRGSPAAKVAAACTFGGRGKAQHSAQTLPTSVFGHPGAVIPSD